MTTIWLDLSEVGRSLRRTPQFAALCIAILGLGIGLGSAMFAAIDAVLLRRLPVREQEHIVVGWGVNQARNLAHLPLRMGEWRAFAERTRALQEVAAVDYNGSWPFAMRDGDATHPVRRALVTGNLFQALGAAPALGRMLEPSDDRVGAEPVAVIGYGFWQRRYNADPGVVGRRLTMHASNVTYTIIGVAAQGLDFPAQTEIWIPIIPATTYPPADTSVALVDVVGRLRSDASAQSAADELTAFLREPHRDAAVRQSAGRMQPFPDQIVGDVRRELILLGAAVGILLLVACLNVAGLLMMRGTQQARLVALRIAVGASRRRIVRWQFTYGLALAACGCVVGVGVAYAALGALRHFAPQALPRLDQVRPDAGVLVVAAVLSVVTALLFTIVPALVAARTDAATLLRAGAPSLSSGRRARRLREGLVVGQVASAVVVLSAALLVVRSFRELQRAELGFVKDGVMVVDLAWDFTRVTTAERSLAIYDELLPRVRAIPGVVDATSLPLTPFSGTGGWDVLFVATDRPAAEQERNPWINMEVVSPSYFDVFRVPLRQGRAFAESDREGAPPVVVLSESAAKALWPHGSALGKQVALARVTPADSSRWTVVGVVADTRYRDYRTPRATVYFPHHQPPFEMAVTMLAVRATGDPLAVLPAVRSALRETSPDVVIGSAATMSTHLDAPLAQPRFNALLLSVFACSALVIVGVGLYAVLAFSVRLRSREFAIRSAVGAKPRALRRLVLQSAATLVGTGVVVGLAIVVGGSRALRSMLYGVTPLDPVSIGAGVLSLTAVALVAMLAPTTWASRTSAARLLREE